MIDRSSRCKLTVVRLVMLVATATLILAGCSSDGRSAISDAAEDAGITGEGVADSVEGAVGDGGDAPATDSTESEKLPDWATVLLVVLAVLAVIGVILGLQNRSARKTQDATEEGYRRAQQDSQST